ncbi:MAG: hypothetical protein LBQ57_07625 [Spirochaetales bacterium]|jgi:hypothetical protein|nr:hypothetical protein [Spirochaetales bacterium]
MIVPEESALTLRRRSMWEAADSGLLLWRESFVYFLPFFALPFWVCAFVLRLLPDDMRLWSWLILWFLKPLFDRTALHVVSIRFFESPAGLKRISKGLGKSIFRGLPGDLLWRRFSPWRSAMMPVRILEGLKAGRVRKRKKILVKGGIDFCVVITIWGVLLEWILLAGEILFGIMMIELFREDLLSLEDFWVRGELFFFTAWCVNYMLVESMYVCMGFGLYINSRVAVEGWDLELLFRKLIKGARPVLKGAVLVFILALGFIPARTAAAEEAVPLDTLAEILESDEFGGERDGWAIRFKNQQEDEEEEEAAPLNTAAWVEKAKVFFAVFLRLLIIAAAAALAVCLIIYVKRNPFFRDMFRGGKPNQRAIPVSAESAAVLFERARRLYGQGDLRGAWAACLVGTMIAVSGSLGISFPAAATEYDCLSLVLKKGDAGGEFTGLVKTWVNFAYGGRLPPDGAFEKALAYGVSLSGGEADRG